MTKGKNQNELKIMSPEQNEILDRPPPGFQARQVIYRKMKVSCTPLEHRYKDVDKPTPHPTTFNIKNLVSKIAKKGYDHNDYDKEEDNFLDITVSQPSYIIIELSRKSGLTFSSKNPAITLGKPLSGTQVPYELYGEVRYVDGDGNVSNNPIKNCRIAYFSAMPRLGSVGQPFTQSLNFNVDTRHGVLIVVDPDIRHPGNATS
jgi:hypothetical protein